MELPDGRTLVVEQGIPHEPTPDGRIVLWLPGERTGGYQHWERVLTAARATVAAGGGVCSIEATAVPVRQRLGRSLGLGRFLDGLRGWRAEQSWTLPGGAQAEQCGARRTGLRLVWAEDEAAPLGEERINALWPQRQESRAVGPNLYLVAAVALERSPASVPGEAGLPPGEPARALAERALESARAAGDRPRTVTALADLGLALLLDGDIQHAAATLAEARAGARALGDPALEADAMSNLALAACRSGHPEQARGLIAPVLCYARDVGDRYAEKLALDRLAQALVGLGEHAGALAPLLEAAALAAGLGDGPHEADLLWRAAIEHAELGQRDGALARAAAAIDRMRGLGNPKADWYAHHLASYRSGAAGPALAATADAGSHPGPSIPAAATGPGLLRMALTAVKAMGAFVGSGFKTASPATYRSRLAACAACMHHTGVRCRVCGCITAAKARILDERCPAGRWPA